MKPEAQKERELMWSLNAVRQYRRARLRSTVNWLACTLTGIIMVVVFACSTSAVEMEALIKDSVIPHDTIADSLNYDSAYTEVVQINGHCLLQFIIEMEQLGGGAGYGPVGGLKTDDSIYAYIEHSPNGIDRWTTVKIDSVIEMNADTMKASTVMFDLDSLTVYGEYLRGLFIYHDQIEADIPDSVGQVNYWRCRLRVIVRD